MIKVIFKDESFWNSSQGECSYNVEMYSLYKIEGVDDSEQCRKYEHDLRGSRYNKKDCLISVFWTLFADNNHDNYCDVYNMFYDFEEKDITLMLLGKWVTVSYVTEIEVLWRKL